GLCAVLSTPGRSPLSLHDALPIYGAQVTVTAGTLLRDLALFPDRLDPAAEVDEALVTLLPGESAVFTVTGATELGPGALTTKPRSEEHTSELQSRENLVCRLLLET